MEQLVVGRAKLTWLRGGVNHLDGGAMFGVVPKILWEKKYPHDKNNLIELRTDPILLQIDNKNYLIDTGIGNDKLTDKQMRNFGVTEQSYLVDSLRELDILPEDINGILMTHLHFDHASGLTHYIDGKFTPVFPNVPIYVSSTEWNEMRKPNIRSINTYWEENWKSIQENVIIFDKELGIVPNLKMIHTGGHSDGHSIIVYEEGESCFIHMADLMPTNAHQNKLWALAYDDYPVDSVHQKEKWMNFGYQKSAWYTFYHDAYYRAIKVDEDGQWQDKIKRQR